MRSGISIDDSSRYLRHTGPTTKNSMNFKGSENGSGGSDNNDDGNDDDMTTMMARW